MSAPRLSRRRLTQTVLSLLALACAALLVVLARGVGAVDGEIDALRGSEARVALAAAPDLPAFGPADRVARSFLSAGDDIEFRRALGLIEESRRLDHLPNRVLELHAQAIALLQRLDDEPRGRASQAATLIGALYIEAEQIDPDAATRLRQQATEAFQTAVRLDPTNDAAKLALELALSPSAGSLFRIGQEGSGGGATGAGESPPGSGY